MRNLKLDSKLAMDTAEDMAKNPCDFCAVACIISSIDWPEMYKPTWRWYAERQDWIAQIPNSSPLELKRIWRQLTLSLVQLAPACMGTPGHPLMPIFVRSFIKQLKQHPIPGLDVI